MKRGGSCAVTLAVVVCGREWLAAKQEVDELKRELDDLRKKRDVSA